MRDFESPEARLARLQTLVEHGPKASDITNLGARIAKVEKDLREQTDAKIDAVLKTIMDQVRDNAEIAREGDKKVSAQSLHNSEEQYKMAVKEAARQIRDAITDYDDRKRQEQKELQEKLDQERLHRKERRERIRSKIFSAAWSGIVLLAVILGSQSKFVGDVLMSVNPFR